jgi:hypothetical protein
MQSTKKLFNEEEEQSKRVMYDRYHGKCGEFIDDLTKQNGKEASLIHLESVTREVNTFLNLSYEEYWVRECCCCCCCCSYIVFNILYTHATMGII